VSPATEITDQVAAATLAALPRTTPGRLLRTLTHWPTPTVALTAVKAGGAAAALGPSDARSIEVARAWAAAADACLGMIAPVMTRRGTQVRYVGGAGYPIDDGIDDRPAVLFTEGTRADVFERPRVAVVGTRAATPHGLADARELGAALARAGVVVVSGLAIGIDGAAHEGALDAGGCVIGVQATGLDVVYPRRHGVLHERVKAHGMLVSEQPFGIGPHPARFPVRNRIIAALSDVTIVVEATQRGGARITARHALDYGRAVLAIPGSRRNPSARGCNELLAEGAQPLLDPADVAVALELSPGSRRHPARGAAGLAGATDDERAVMRALGGEPATSDELVGRTGLSPGGVAVAVAGLVRAARASRAHGLIWPQ
jgi:DNA processing protein